MECNLKFKHYIRPGLMIVFSFVFVTMIFIDGKLLQIKNVYIDVMQTLLVTMVMFYFGGRSWEKVNHMKQYGQNNLEIGE